MQQRYHRCAHRFNAALHENTGAAIRAGKNKSARLETTARVCQGCILAPALLE